MRRPPPPPTDDRSVPQAEPRDERMATLRSQQLLAELAARAEMERGDSPYYADERVVGWLAREVSSQRSLTKVQKPCFRQSSPGGQSAGPKVPPMPLA